jgi:hypothetical protein
MTTNAAGATRARGSEEHVRRTSHDQSDQPAPWARASAKAAKTAIAGDHPEKRAISPGIQAAHPQYIVAPAIKPARLAWRPLNLGKAANKGKSATHAKSACARP